MTKYQLNRPDGPWDYPQLGFRAAAGAILDGSQFSPAITDPPDPYWTVYAGGSAQTGITLINPNGTVVPTPQPADGSIGIYKRSIGTYQLVSPTGFVQDPEVAAALSASFAQVVGLGTSNGVDDTAALNALLATPGPIIARGVPGQTYLISAPLVVHTATTLDMTNCAVRLLPNSNKNLVNNAAIGTHRFVADAAVAAGSTTLTSATAAFASGDVGKQIVVWDAGNALAPLFTTIASRTNPTTVELATAAVGTVTGMALSIGLRDKNITILGGDWDANGNVGTGSPAQHMLRFEHVDGFSIDGAHITGVTAGYGLNLSDATDFDITNIEIDCTKGQVQPTGPLWRGRIGHITGKQADDCVALVCNDWPGITYNRGPISDITITDLKMKSSIDFPADCAVLKLLAGSPYWMRNVTFDNVQGTSQGTPVKIGDDGAFPETTNSKMSGIKGRNISCRSTGKSAGMDFPLVTIEAGPASDIRDVTLSGLRWSGSGPSAGFPTAAVAVFAIGTYPGAVLGSLTVEDLEARGDYMSAVRIARVRVKRLSLPRLRMPVAGTASNGVFLLDVNTSIDSLDITDADLTLTGAGAAVYNQGGRLDRLSLSSVDVHGGAAAYQQTAQGAPRTLLRMANVYADAGSLVVAASPFDLDVINTSHAGSQAIITTAYIGADGSTVFGRVRNPLGRTKLTNAGGAAVKWTEPAETFAYSSNIGDILAMGPALWVRADVLAATLANNAAVAAWPDSSGNAREMTQATAGQQPQFKTAQQNGLPAVVFDGTDDWLARAGVPIGTAISVFAVARLDAAGSYGDLLSYNATELEVRHNAATRRPELATSGGSATSATALTLGTWHQWTATADAVAPATEVRIDGTSVATSASAFAHGATGTIALGARSAGTSMFGGALAEVLVIPRAVTTAERTAVEAYLKAKWATP